MVVVGGGGGCGWRCKGFLNGVLGSEVAGAEFGE